MIVCLSGYKGSGKDTAANYLIEKYQAVRVALADPLKDSVAEEFGIDRDSFDDPKLKESPLLNMPVNPRDGFGRMIADFMVREFKTADGDTRKPAINIFGNLDPMDLDSPIILDTRQLYWTPRALAILKGSTNRSVMSNFWTQKTFEKAEKVLNENPNKIIIVTDLRYKSEMVQFKERFGDQAVFVRINRHKESTSTDPSEIDLNDAEFDFYIDNTKDISSLHRQIEDIFLHL